MAVINTNYLALVSQNNLNKSQNSLGTAIQRLSSGLRINSAKDDAAGQAIANRMTAQIRGMTQAARNANDGISLAQTAEGNLSEINNNLQRIRELAVQAANDVNGTADRTSIQEEIKSRLEEIDRVAKGAKFNETQLLNGTGTINLQVGANTTANDSIAISTTDATVSGLGISGTASGGDVSTSGNAQTMINAMDAAIKKVDSARSTLGTYQNRLESTVANLNNTITNLSASRSRIEDADYATEVSNMTRSQILQQAGTAVLAQANQVPQTMLSLLR
ncbi:flagellin [Castellaniella denitrificans]|uniref:Flagellin n=1 Tax=Castellaniella denitrificans TaxID=56119 RepID=A0ABT4M4I0_9BURK|nr:flagellin [Castellaniella denitrificans]MCZ4330207.1 flagellin [Castellaniella denitrificans]